jgi:DNA-binding MarR family transcriptional regulator
MRCIHAFRIDDARIIWPELVQPVLGRFRSLSTTAFAGRGFGISLPGHLAAQWLRPVRQPLALRDKCAYARIYVHMRSIRNTDDKGADSMAPISPACACGRLRRATRALTQLYDDAMTPAGLRITQFSLLRTLASRGAVRISDLADALLLDRTALSRNLDPLVTQGYVAIDRGDDARTREAEITRKGSAALKAATPYWAKAQKEVAKQLGTDKLEALIGVLGELEALHPSRRPAPSARSGTGRRTSSATGRHRSNSSRSP